jgi:hypothetical protein
LGTHWVGFFGVGSLLLLLIALVAWDRTRAGDHGPSPGRRRGIAS